MSPSLPLAEGFVLAGGRSSRMGSDKALLELSGIPLIQHALGILRQAGMEARIAGAQNDLSVFAPVVPDESGTSGLGPLAGICAALKKANAQYAVFLPVDLPLIPASLISYMLQHAIACHSAVTVISEAGFLQTFPVVTDRGAAGELQTALHSDRHGCLSAFRAAAQALDRPLSTLPVELLVSTGQVFHARGLSAHSWFRNVNSPRDLIRAEREISTRAPAGERSARIVR